MSKKLSPVSGRIPKTFIREWREWKGYTLADIARRIEATPPTLSRVETGQGMLTWAVINAVAEAIDQSPYDLLFRDPRAEGVEEFVSELRQASPAAQDLITKLGRTVIAHDAFSSDGDASPLKQLGVNQKHGAMTD